LLGKTLEENGIVFNINRDFYDGIRMDIDQALDLIGKSSIINMVGKEIVGAAINRGLVHAEAVIKICGIPHAQIVKM
jgi:hypothetical protein